ncbi:ER-golgi trafficking TRAPP I complex 85 kDa subunit-domain-containing protein [Apodospora peruviana]|uniref:ER-golgi trafficking TRAPP I complex 85 kDa subunit-domain-containing protein n=1 Tax=Apodospora peruviana TaxID=516989 RepID=A0AAE0I6J6_9PEZI|nr:ER-golgi trafficking TRAPP I complex 85 kDa subunit-domain-containing protein [Apodospora peruviana]
MQPSEDDPLTASLQSLPMAASSIRPPKQRLLSSDSVHPLAQSEASLPLRPASDHQRRSNPSAASLFRSTLTPPGSRSASPAPSLSSGTRSPGGGRALSGSVFGGGGGNTAFKQSLLDTPGAADNPGDPLNLVLRSFVPHIAIHGSQDVDELVREKGFSNGLWELLRPFGERIQGKVTIRDSNGLSRSWEDFAVRFTRFGDGVETPDPAVGGGGRPPTTTAANGGQSQSNSRMNLIAQVERVVDRHLSYAEDACMGGSLSPTTPTRQGFDIDATSPYYALYLRRLLSGIPLACHESFAHPVAAVMAISSRNPSPIDALRKLYVETSQGEHRLPVWVDGDYLRYYVLVHDEEQSDITKSMALFEQMKRHFGLHCHLLRIRSSQSAETDDDSIPLPRSDWMTAAEELADIERSEDDQQDYEDPTARHIFESDATAIRTFIREMVTQSVVPTMERNISVWNDQVASRRKGLSGKLMSFGKRWGAFGSSSRASSGAGAGAASASNNYDSLGYYKPDTPEAIMRRLADFAFMLRDWKLAMSTYELLRTDFQNDKAWRYHAAANEMAALALLIMPQSMSSKTRIDTINQMLEQTFYSYHTRCNSPYGAVRSIILALELLRLRGGSGIDEAVRWGIRLMEARLMGPVGDSLLRERMAICYASKQGAGSQAWGSRRRKSALWSVLGAEAWIGQEKYIQAQRCLNEARKMYSLLPAECGVQKFVVASDFLAQLNDQLKEGLRMDVSSQLMDGEGGDGLRGGGESEKVDEESETMDDRKKARRTSLISSGGGAGGAGGLETAPLTPLQPARLLHTLKDDDVGGRDGKDGFG